MNHNSPHGMSTPPPQPVNTTPKDCIICSEPLHENDMYIVQCCFQTIHERCMNQHAHYCRREFLKQHQNLDGFHVSCLFCRDDTKYVIKQGPTFSIPSSLHSSDIPELSGTVSGFTSLVGSEGQSDPSYYPEPHVTDQEIESIVEGETYCSICSKRIPLFDDSVKLGCCGKYVHRMCDAETEKVIRDIGMRKHFRGSSCLTCNTAKFMIHNDLRMCEEIHMENGIHPMAASPTAHYLITCCVFYLHGFNFRQDNPMSLKRLFDRSHVLQKELDKAKIHFIQNEQDNELLKAVSEQTSSLHKMRNGFLDPDRALDVMGKIPNCEAIMKQLYSIHCDAKGFYPDLYRKLLEAHVSSVRLIVEKTQGTPIHPPKHICMKPCCRTMCVEAHPLIRVPTVGPLPTTSILPYQVPPRPPSVLPQHMGSMEISDKAFSSPSRHNNVSEVQASCVEPQAHSPMTNQRAESPRRMPSKRNIITFLLHDAHKECHEITNMEAIIQTLKAVDCVPATATEYTHQTLIQTVTGATEDDMDLILKTMNIFTYDHVMKKIKTH